MHIAPKLQRGAGMVMQSNIAGLKLHELVDIPSQILMLSPSRRLLLLRRLSFIKVSFLLKILPLYRFS